MGRSKGKMAKMCSRCKTRVAVVFVTRVEGDKTYNEGLCLKCAKELGVKPIDDIISRMGISEDDLDAMMDEVSSLIPTDGVDGGGEGDEGRAPAINFGALFPGMQNQQNSYGEQSGERKETPRKDPSRKFLNQFCQNLTAKAAEGKVDRIVGRDKELTRVMQILCRRQKNNPCLIGEPGVGKTAVAEALALRISEGKVPYKLKDKEVHLVDMTAMVAGTQFRGQFENRMKGLIEEVKKLGNIILVIDEVHSIVAAGDAEGGMNAANILKPALSRGEIQVIGATTLTEYRKYIEKDSALERRFQPVMIEEPSIDDTVEILKGIKGYYEKFHGVHISDDLIRRMVSLSERYITDRYLPDKAIDLMDEAASRLAMESPVVGQIAELDKQLSELAKRREELESAELDENGYKELTLLRIDEDQKQEEFKKLSRKRDKLRLTDDDVARVIEVWTGIPASSITENEFAKIDRLEAELKKRIIGQDEAVSKVARAIKRNRAGVSYKKKPVSFIFAGSTGVGKTELVKVLANYLFNSPESLIRLDMSEFMEKYSVSRIIGSPPGYVGYDDAGQLTEKIRRKPYSVVLFDEIEKAHPDVMNILLQILDDGRITDSHGKEVNFESTVIIMTTNAGSTNASPTAGFNVDAKDSDTSRTMRALERFLRPEFLNRVDEIVVFNRLTKDNMREICGIMLNDLKGVLAEKDISLTWDGAAVDALCAKGFSEKYGARNLRRLIQTEVEDAVASKIIENYKTPISAVSLSADGDAVIVCCI